jgi:hypothetical protein
MRLRLREILRLRGLVREAREIVRDAREAARDGIDEGEAEGLVRDALDLAGDLAGAVELSPSTRAVLKASAEEILRRLG